MNDSIIQSTDIFLQDVVCSVVFNNPQMPDFELYNKIVEKVDVPDIETTGKILSLIKINKMAATN